MNELHGGESLSTEAMKASEQGPATRVRDCAEVAAAVVDGGDSGVMCRKST